jgi:CRISPR-associated endonuclease/helicase Cas3/CRISPR-associated endonuclease Cas3-HD
MQSVFAHDPADGGDILLDHGGAVAQRATIFADETGAETPDGTPISRITDPAGVLHDIGKATDPFQAYVTDEDATVSPHDHAPIGAVATFAALSARGLSPRDAVLGFLAVALHHSDFPKRNSPLHYIDKTYIENENKRESIRNVAEKIDTHDETRRVADELCRRASDGELRWQQLSSEIASGEVFDDIKRAIRKSPVPGVTAGIDDEQLSEDHYAAFLHAWTSLVLADKTVTATLDRETIATARRLHRKTVKETIEDKDETSSLDALRNEAHETVIPNAERFATDESSSVATLRLPTGLGKTLTGLDAAFSIREERDTTGPVVYALPYTSIVEQTVDVVDGIFTDCDPTDPEFTVHQYLSETITERESDEITVEEASAASLAAETWGADIIVTTFVQLFESLIGPTNSRGLKLPNLSEATVILDEPQALPETDWPLIQDATAVLRDDWDASVVSMTATQPRLFKSDDRFNTTALVPDAERFFTAPSVQRVRYTFHESVPESGSQSENPLSYERAAATLIEDTASDRSAMAICNTKASSRQLIDSVHEWAEGRSIPCRSLNELYDCLALDGEANPTPAQLLARAQQSDVAEDDGLLTLHLTSRHRPIDRRRLLEAVESLADTDLRVLFVATQIVEAGADISFQCVYRDYAPIPNIVQAAGRCNRESESDRGTVTVWQLSPASKPTERNEEDDAGATLLPSEQVYSDLNQLEATTRALTETVDAESAVGLGNVSSSRINLDAVDGYYGTLIDRGVGESDVSPISDCDLAELKEYSLIDDESVDVLVLKTEDEREVVWEIQRDFADGEYDDARSRLGELTDRRVSVRVQPDQDEHPIEVSLDTLGPTQVFVLDLSNEEDARWYGEIAGVMG